MTDISNRREFVWDDLLIDEEKTTAERVLHEPVAREKVFTFDAPWEGNGCIYFHIVHIPETGMKRMYYCALRMKTGPDDPAVPEVRICAIESADGISWSRPDLGIVELNGSKRNNILITKDKIDGIRDIDNFFVMRDVNPAPAVRQKYKAVMQYTGSILPDGRRDRRLITLVSDDGYSFEVFGEVCDYGTFDSLNTVHYNQSLGKYVCFFRSLHDRDTGADYERSRAWNEQVRDIRVSFSDDFITWSAPERISYSDGQDIPMYTNCVSPYPGAEHIMTGIPTRYTEYGEWTPNFDRLCGSEARRGRMQLHPRYGLALTDCAFMCSRDGIRFTRYDEAFIRPGPEHPANWVYGCCYPAVGYISTPALFKGSDDELSIYMKTGHWMDMDAELYRLTLRRDGFVSMHAGKEEKKIVTKPFIFRGSRLSVNFATSARGYISIRLAGAEGSAGSCMLFGDSTDREVDLAGGIAVLSGTPVTMEITLRDADFWSWRFV